METIHKINELEPHKTDCYLVLQLFVCHEAWYWPKRVRAVGDFVYTAKSYVLNQNWHQSDPDLYPEAQLNFFGNGSDIEQ